MAEAEKPAIDYIPSAHVAELRRLHGVHQGRGGPPGGGKSVGAFMDALLRAMRQPPDRERVRRFKLGIARATYPKLKTLQEWMPRVFGDVKLTAPWRACTHSRYRTAPACAMKS